MRTPFHQVMTTATAIDAALREIDATADMDPARLDGMSPACLRALVAGMIDQAREVRDGLLAQATSWPDPAPGG